MKLLKRVMSKVILYISSLFLLFSCTRIYICECQNVDGTNVTTEVMGANENEALQECEGNGLEDISKSTANCHLR